MCQAEKQNPETSCEGNAKRAAGLLCLDPTGASPATSRGVASQFQCCHSAVAPRRFGLSGHKILTVGGKNFALGLTSQVCEPKVGRLSERACTAPPSPQIQCWGLQTCDLTGCDHLFLSEGTPCARRITNIVFGGEGGAAWRSPAPNFVFENNHV